MGAGPEEPTAPGAGAPAPAWTDDALFALLDELRGEGFPIGVGEYLEAQAAAAACHRDGLDGDPRRLRNYLAPVLWRAWSAPGERSGCSLPHDRLLRSRTFP